jgi:hypothetical protein
MDYHLKGLLNVLIVGTVFFGGCGNWPGPANGKPQSCSYGRVRCACLSP